MVAMSLFKVSDSGRAKDSVAYIRKCYVIEGKYLCLVRDGDYILPEDHNNQVEFIKFIVSKLESWGMM